MEDSTTSTAARSQELDATSTSTVEVLLEGRLADLVAAWERERLESYKFEAATGRISNWEDADLTTGAVGLNPPGIDITSGYRYILTPEGARRTYRGEWKVLSDRETVPEPHRQAATWLLDQLPESGQPDTRNGRPVTFYRIEDPDEFAIDIGSWSAGKLVVYALQHPPALRCAHTLEW